MPNTAADPALQMHMFGCAIVGNDPARIDEYVYNTIGYYHIGSRKGALYTLAAAKR